jgi:hypothetical protein
VAEAYAIDQRTSSKIWTLAVGREMFVDDNVIPAFWKPVGVHMIFDVKMDLMQKARLVANGRETEVTTLNQPIQL